MTQIPHSFRRQFLFCSGNPLWAEGRSNQKPEHLENQFTRWCAELTEAAELGEVIIVKFFSWEELTWKSADYRWYLLSQSVCSTMTLSFCIYRCTCQSNGREIQINSVENVDNIWTLVPSGEVLLSVTLQNRNLNWFLQKCSTYPSVMSEEDGVTLYVSMDHTLCVKDRQRLQDGQTHCGDLLLIHPADE